MDSESIDHAPPGETKASARPKASTWLWHPWYAKLWWGAGLLYWSCKLLSYWSSILDALYATALAGMLNVFFFPPTIAMVLGSGLVRAWMDYKGLEWGPPTRDHLFPKRSVGGFVDPMADPLDPRSPKYWQRHHRR